MKKVEYNDVLEANCTRITDFFNSDYYNSLKVLQESHLIKNIIFKTLYIDPDKEKSDKCKRTGRVLSADGIVSARKLYELFDGENSLLWLEKYKSIRKESFVIIFWPPHRGGINSCKARVFADRIDYTLFDIKMFYEIIKDYKQDKTIKKRIYDTCKLGSAFTKDMTYSWLCAFDGFKDFISNRGLNRFVNNNFDVIDLETGEPIKDYKEGNEGYKWGNSYYDKLEKLSDFVE